MCMSKAGVMTGIVCVALCAGACGGGTPTSPSSGAVVTLTVADETFRVWVAGDKQIAAAQAAFRVLPTA